MLNINVKEQIKSLEEKENNFLLDDLEVSIKAGEDSFAILDLDSFGQTYQTINYTDVKRIEIDSILVGIELNDGTTYLLKEIRNDLVEILADFNEDCCITKYKVIEEDGEIKYKTEHYFIIEDFEVINNEENNTVKISNEFSSYNIDYDDIISIEEDYYGEGMANNRSVRIELTDNEYISIESV